jgi:cytochrome c2
MNGGRVLAALGAGLTVTIAAVSLGVGTTAGSSGTSSSPSPARLARGRMLFQDVARDNFRCAFCHTLRSAEATGVFAVDLDNEFALDRKAGWSDDRIRREVLRYLSNPPCFDPQNASRCMPTSLYTGAAAATLATFVSHCAGRSTKPGCAPIAGGLTGEVGRGEHVFVRSGCPSCHFAASGKPIGPSLNGLAGSRVELASGKTVVADDAYLLESILAPDAKIVAGYPSGFMSSRIKPGTITPAEARELIAYIKSLR